jgi:hypothetical protein
MGILEFVIGKTPVINRVGSKRGDEIQKFIDEFDGIITKFIIIDDDDDMKHLIDNLVLIDYKTGITEKDAIEIIKKLI